MLNDMIGTELERRILHGLALEWKNALYLLDPKYRGLIRRPSFGLKDMKRRLGCWSGEKEEITINRGFALAGNWDSVRRILLHEMAHQIAEQAFGAQTETPHGPLFRKACYLLRADHRASEEYVEGNSGMMTRIKKLFALAESSNRNEAESAMRKAHELSAKYNIDILARNTERNFTSVFAGTPALKHHREEYDLARLIREYYFVWTIWVPAYVIEKEKMGRVLELSGTPDNISIASYVYDFIRRYIENRWVEYNKENLLNRYRKTDFASGIIRGFSGKLKSNDGIKNHEAYALIKAGDPMLKKYAKHRYPHTVTISRKGSSCDKDVLQDGIEIGKELVISKGITVKGLEKLLLPGY
ncbi:MAG: DUF2786 domain-containing protein [Desulfobacterales bacterium]